MKWYSYSYSEPQAVSRTSTSTAQAEYEYDNAVISGFGQHLVVAISEKCQNSNSSGCRRNISPQGISFQTKGSNQAPNKVTAKPVIPIRVRATENDFKVCVVVIPVMVATCQKPLSFIHGSGFEPQPMAKAR
jgi:hypothetical protein